MNKSILVEPMESMDETSLILMLYDCYHGGNTEKFFKVRDILVTKKGVEIDEAAFAIDKLPGCIQAGVNA